MDNQPMFNPGLPPVAAEAPVIETATEAPAPVTAVVEPPVVSTSEVVEPVAAAQTIDITADTPPTPTEAIREVEKIVEKYPEMDEYTKEIFDALLAGEETKLLSYLSEKNRDYKTMSDYDVVINNLLKKNPHYSHDDATLKIEMQYGEIAKIDLSKIDKDTEPDIYEAAVAHNTLADRNQKMLKLDAVEARASLEAGKKEIKLPKITTAQPVVESPNQPTAESIEQGRRDWVAQVEAEVPTIKELSFKVGSEKDGFEDVTYAITDKEKTETLDFFKDLNFNKLVERLGWRDATGKQNVAKMAGDVLKLERVNQLVASAYTQGRTAGTTDTVVGIKNLDLNQNNSSSVAAVPVDIGLLGFGHLNPK